MLTKEQLEKYADVLIWGLYTSREDIGGQYSPGDVIRVYYESKSLRLAEIVYRKLLERKMHVVMQAGMTPQMEVDYYGTAEEEQLQFSGSWTRDLYRHMNGNIMLLAPASLTHLKNADPKKMVMSGKARKPLMDILRKKDQDGEYGWTLCMLPTAALARQAKMTVAEYTAEIIRACHLDKDDPVAVWSGMRDQAEIIKAWLTGMSIEYIHIESDNIDLRVAIGGRRRWLGFTGQNIPSFEIFTCPDWRGTEGVYYANEPSLQSGKCIKGIRLEFRAGRVIRAESEQGEDYLKQMVAMDKGAGQLGEVSFTDKRFSPITKFMANTLYDENVGGEQGNCHVAIGRSFPDAFDGNPKQLTKKLKKQLGLNESALHWDLINTEKKRATAYLKDGTKVVIYEDGMFKS